MELPSILTNPRNSGNTGGPLLNIPSKGLQLIGGIALGLIISPIWISIDANFYILLFTEQTKINWIHAEAGTIDTEIYKQDLEDTFSSAKRGHKNWKNQID